MPLHVARLAPPDAVQAPAPLPNEPEIPGIPEPQEVERSPSPDIPVEPPVPQLPAPIPQLPRRSTRPHNPPGEWWRVRNPPPPVPDDESDDELAGFIYSDYDHGFKDIEFINLAGGTEPRTYSQAMKGPDAEHWKQAAIEEINAHLQNGTWSIVKLPPGKKAIGSGWVWRVKFRADGSIEHYKGRFVAKGYSQRPGFDYNEVFAPTVRNTTIRTVIALAAIEDLHLQTVDISNAFLKGELEEEIYMEQPEGFREFGPEYVCKLQKSIYGLKQASRQWNKKLHATLVSMGFIRLESDRSVYIYTKNGVRIIVPIFVDDITLASKSQKALDDTVEELSKHFPLRDLGPTSFLLGINIIRDRSK
jgi:hypothetical protein